MNDLNMMIGNNIYGVLAERDKKPAELAIALGKPVRYVRDILNGRHLIKGYELKQIADWLEISQDILTDVSDQYTKRIGIEGLMSKAETEGEKKAVRLADEVSDMIFFHRTVRENSIRMSNPAYTKKPLITSRIKVERDYQRNNTRSDAR